MRYAPHELDQLDFAITVALSLLPEKDRPRRPPALATLAHAAHWTKRVVVDPGTLAADVAAADTPAAFDDALAAALERIARANAIQMGPGLIFGKALTLNIDARRTAALVAEAAEVAERLRPVVEKTQADLIAAAGELPSGADALDAEAILAAGAGDPWQRAHAELAKLLIVVGIVPKLTIGDGDWQVRADLRHLSSVMALVDVEDVGSRIHDIIGADRTEAVDPDRSARIAEVHRFIKETVDLAPTGVLLSVAQGRWPAVKLAYEPTGKVALGIIRNANTSRMVSRDDMRDYAAGIRKVSVR